MEGRCRRLALFVAAVAGALGACDPPERFEWVVERRVAALLRDDLLRDDARDAAALAALSPEDLRSAGVSLYRGPCYGHCPVYELVLRGDGTCTVLSENEAARRRSSDTPLHRQGGLDRTLPAPEVRRVIGKFLRVGFFQQPDELPGGATDISYTTLELDLGGRHKRVEYGDGTVDLETLAWLMDTLLERCN